MNIHVRHSRCGFVVIKLRIDDEDYLMMRRDLDWKDINFIGGHEEKWDHSNLANAARREMLEEVPSLRKCRYELNPLTDEISYGPISSRSAGCTVNYTLRFFLLRFSENPKRTIQTLGSRSLNTLIRQRDVLLARTYKVTAFAGLLNDRLPGGLESICYSWPEDLGFEIRNSPHSIWLQRSIGLE